MNAALDLVNSCKNGVFPSIHTMSIYGLNGESKASPVDILDCYIIATIDDKLSEFDLCNCDNINSLLNEKTSKLKTAPCYTRVMNSGGIQISSKNNKECKNCFYNGIPKKCC